MEQYCIWGTEENDSDCISDMHAFVTCIKCHELCPSCIYEVPIEKQIQICEGE